MGSTDLLARRPVLVTGAGGFFGKHVVGELRRSGARQIIAPARSEVDLRDVSQTCSFLRRTQPGIIVHLAAKVGGIGANRDRPGEFFYDNAIMGIQLMEAARLTDVEKFVTLGTICSYPKHAPIPFKETDLWNGYPEETNAPYGLAKKMLLVQGQAYRQQYGFNAIHLLVVNLYGPGDHFDLETSHVIPAMIRRFSEAKRAGAREVVLWGTGTPTREFLYVADAARAVALATSRYDQPEPVNIGSSFEISIRDLAMTVARLVGFDGVVRWDSSKPDGQPRRKLDVSRARDSFGFEATTDFEAGLRETIAWYRTTYEEDVSPASTAPVR